MDTKLRRLHEDLVLASGDGELSIVKNCYEQLKFLKSENSPLFDEIINDSVHNAWRENKWNIIQYIVEETDKLGPNDYFDPKALLKGACENNLPNFVRYLLNFNKTNNIKLNLDLHFEKALKSNNFELLSIFIFEENIPKTVYIQRCLDMNYSGIGDEVEKMFESRELTSTLIKELNNTETTNLTNKKAKI